MHACDIKMMTFSLSKIFLSDRKKVTLYQMLAILVYHFIEFLKPQKINKLRCGEVAGLLFTLTQVGISFLPPPVCDNIGFYKENDNALCF